MYSKNVIFVVYIFLMALMGDFQAAQKLEDQDSLAPYLNKKYRLVSSDAKFEEIMKALGVGFLKRKLANFAYPVMELTKKGDEYTLSSESVFKNVYIKFKIGQEFKELTPDDRVVSSVITQDKNKLIHTQKGDKTTITTREFGPDKVRVVVQVDDIISVRIYKDPYYNLSCNDY